MVFGATQSDEEKIKYLPRDKLRMLVAVAAAADRNDRMRTAGLLLVKDEKKENLIF